MEIPSSLTPKPASLDPQQRAAEIRRNLEADRAEKAAGSNPQPAAYAANAPRGQISSDSIGQFLNTYA